MTGLASVSTLHAQAERRTTWYFGENTAPGRFWVVGVTHGGKYMGMVVDSALYVAGHRDQSVSIDAARPPEQSGQFVWIGLLEPSEEMLRNVQARFGLHDLAIEDAHRAHQRPKLEVYDHSLFVVLRTAELKGGRVDCGETHIFIGPGYVITVRHGASSSYSCCVINPTLAQ
jgi:Mg2+ and Co2+ transporter CorA